MMGRSGESVQWQGVGLRMIDIMSAAGCVTKWKEAWSRDPRDRDVPCCEDSIPEFPENLQIPPCPAEVQLLHEILHILYARQTPAINETCPEGDHETVGGRTATAPEDRTVPIGAAGYHVEVRVSKHSTVCNARFFSSRPPTTYILPADSSTPQL